MDVLPSLDATSVLVNLLDEPVVVVDVGCRWGFADVWTGLGDRCTIIGFDPDVSECEQLRQRYLGRPNVRVEPVGLGAETGLATLYRTKNPGGYSLYPPSEVAVSHHPGLESGALVDTTVVEVTTLDEWCAGNDCDHVDIVKIDTQGSELDILRGGARTLDSVLALEVEVEFNELYEGVPLFSDIDRYLREQGFVLWRLRNLAHYAQYDVPRTWPVPDSIHFDEDSATIATGSGQLYWANAHYLRADMVRRPPDAGWPTLVRDACVTSALCFHDLAGLAMARARAAAPESVVAALAQAQDEAALALRRAQELMERSVILRVSLTLDAADPRFAGAGWWAPNHFPFGPVRWSGPTREASIDLPVTLPPGTRVELLEVSAMSPAISETLVLEANQVPLTLTRSPHRLGVLHAAVVPPDYDPARRFTRLIVRTVDTVPFNRVHPESGDDREMGVAVAWLKVTAPEGG